MEMIEMRMSDQHQINLWQILNAAAGVLEPLHEKNPVREVWIDQQIQIGELAEKGSMADPGDCDLAFDQLGIIRRAARTAARRKPSLPNHFIKECARIEMVAGGKVFE